MIKGLIEQYVIGCYCRICEAGTSKVWPLEGDIIISLKPILEGAEKRKVRIKQTGVNLWITL